MRRFLVGSCCVIVALQLLIGVPLAVCIGFLSVVENDYAVEMQPVAWNALSPCAEPGSAPCTDYCPSTYAPLPPPTAGVLPPALPPLIVSPPPVAPMVPTSLVAASPVLWGETAPTEITDELIATYKQVAEAETGVIAPPASETQASCHCENALVDSLSGAVTHLYELARNLEADGSYGRADQIRDLARNIREEIHLIHRDLAPPADPPAYATASAPPTVTEAPFNPEPPPAPQDAASSFEP